MSTIDLTRADTEPLAFDERISVPAGCGGEDTVAVGEVRVAGSIEKASHGYFLTGTLQAGATLRCVRCLSEFPFGIEEQVDLMMVPAAHVPREDEARLGKDELEVRFYGEPHLDIGELAAEQVELALPMKPLCRSDCRGICRRCGANLNEWECSCPPDTGDDPRFSALLGWRRGKEQ